MTPPGTNSLSEYRKLLAFGSGVGVEIDGGNLQIAVARVRPTGVEVLARTTLRGFRERPAAEWGGEYAALLKSLGEGRLSATVLLERSEVIVRHVALAGVARKDIDAAIGFQLDTLHPYGEDDVVYGWSPLGSDAVLVGIERREQMERYAELFAAAGVAVASFTFSAAVLHAAVRIFSMPPGDGFVAVNRAAGGVVEVYGESPARPVFSAEFELAPERAALLAAAELRLPPETAAMALDEVLPKPRGNSGDAGAPLSTLAYAAAVAGACPWVAPTANLLPAERRTSHSRALFMPTLVLAVLMLLTGTSVLVYSAYANRRYMHKLEEEIARLEPRARQAEAMDRAIEAARRRARLIDEFHSHTRQDLDALNEMTRVLAPPTWANNIELTRDTATVNGESESAAALLKVLDSSPLFQNSEFSVISRTGNNETFRIRTVREGQK